MPSLQPARRPTLHGADPNDACVGRLAVHCDGRYWRTADQRTIS
jgi:hypothetical protein